MGSAFQLALPAWLVSFSRNRRLKLRKMAEKKEKEGEEKKSLPQMVPKHHWECNKEWYSRKEVEKSQEEFPWKVTECYNGEPWISWEVLGLEVKDERYKLRWRTPVTCPTPGMGL